MKTKLLRKIRNKITIEKQGAKYFLVDKFLNIEDEFYKNINYKEMLQIRRSRILCTAYNLYNKKIKITEKYY